MLGHGSESTKGNGSSASFEDLVAAIELRWMAAKEVANELRWDVSSDAYKRANALHEAVGVELLELYVAP